MTFKLTNAADQMEPVDRRPPLRPGVLVRHNEEKDQFYLVLSEPVWTVCPYGSKNTGWLFDVWSLGYRQATNGLWLVDFDGVGWEIL